MQSERVVIITDIHGCLDECRQLLDKLSFDKTKDMLINLGDTIDRGPKIYELFVFLRELKEEMGDKFIMLRGNHEQMMLDSLDGSKRHKDLWYFNSGEKTVYSFINNKHKIKEFRSWYEAMPFYYTEERFQCVHACLKDEDPAKNDVETLIWGRDTDYAGKLVMTGHTPYKIPLYFNGKEPVGVLNEGIWGKLPKNGMIALDTGCVYGNCLTGMVIEEDRFKIESVPSTVSPRN